MTMRILTAMKSLRVAAAGLAALGAIAFAAPAEARAFAFGTHGEGYASQRLTIDPGSSG